MPVRVADCYALVKAFRYVLRRSILLFTGGKRFAMYSPSTATKPMEDEMTKLTASEDFALQSRKTISSDLDQARRDSAENCPFCGYRSARCTSDPGYNPVDYEVSCAMCGARGPTCSDTDRAWDAWNLRRSAPHVWSVGDRVRYAKSGAMGKVLGVNGHDVWVAFDDATYGTIQSHQLA